MDILLLILGVLLLLVCLGLIYIAYVKPPKDGREPGCLPAIACLLVGFVATALIIAALAGPEVAVRWLVG